MTYISTALAALNNLKLCSLVIIISLNISQKDHFNVIILNIEFIHPTKVVLKFNSKFCLILLLLPSFVLLLSFITLLNKNLNRIQLKNLNNFAIAFK